MQSNTATALKSLNLHSAKMTPQRSTTTKSPRRTSHRSSQDDSVNNSKFGSLLKRTKKVLDLRSASNSNSSLRVKRIKKILSLRSEFSSLGNSKGGVTHDNRRSGSSSQSVSGSTSSYVGIYDPMPEKVQFTMSVDLDFLFCVNREMVAADNHPLRPLHSGQPDRGLDQLKRIFLINRLTINEAPSPAAYDFNNWNIAPNIFAEYFDSQTDCARILTSTGRIKLQNISKWDLIGAQLISRELTAPECDSSRSSMIQNRRADKSLLEISDYLKALTNTESPNSPCFILTRPDVNRVGISIGTRIDEKPMNKHIDMLKHLALILVEYEDIISLFHHPDRRGWTNARANTRSHRYGAKDNTHVCGTLSIASLLDIKAQIFGCRDIHALAELMEAENEEASFVKTMDWSSLADFGRLTFFQHAGSQGILEIGFWIRFVITLFRLAERRSFGILTPLSPVGLNIDMHRIGEVNRLWVFEAQERRADQLLDLLGLSRSDSKYWQGRMHEYAKDEYLHRYRTSGFEKCPACELVVSGSELGRLPQSPIAQRQLQQEIEQLISTNFTPNSPLIHAEIEALTVDHTAPGKEISTFAESLGLVPTKYSRAGGLVWQIFELAQDYVALEEQIHILEDRTDIADAETAVEIRRILRDDRRLHREIELFLETQPDASALGEHRLLRELHQLRVSHARMAATIDTLRPQAANFSSTMQLGAGKGGFDGETLRQRGPHMKALVHGLLTKLQQVQAGHATIEQGLRRDRAVLEALENNERVVEETILQREGANRDRLRDLAAQVLGRPGTVFESGGPERGEY